MNTLTTMMMNDAESPRSCKDLFEKDLIVNESKNYNNCSSVMAPLCHAEVTTCIGDDQSIMTAPTVALNCEDDDGSCCSMDGQSDVYDTTSVASSTGLNCVSFDLTDKVREVPNRNDYTAEELEATWYGRREKEVMRQAAFGIAESLDIHYFHDYQDRSSSTRFRGLESYTQEGSEQRNLHRVKNLVAVLREQRRQRCCGELVTNGPELLEAACYTTSTRCQKLAGIQGNRDERDARGSDDSSGKDKSPSMLLQLTKLLRQTS